MNDILERCLDDLEDRLDPQDEERIEAEWLAFCRGEYSGEIFSPRRIRTSAPGLEWPHVRVNQTLEDMDAMLLQQLGGCSAALASGSGAILNVRANYGTSILPLLFGVKPFVMADELDTLPTSEPLQDADAIRGLVDAGVPDLTRGYGARVMEAGRRFAELARSHPLIGRYVHVYHPDLQGPLDVCEVVWGSSIFPAFYDEPELVHRFLRLVTATYAAFTKQWEGVVPFGAEVNTHWGCMYRGSLMIRLDSAMNISRQMYDEFSYPYDRRLLEEFGGGAIHFCGRGEHFIPSLCHLPGLSAINMSQPHLNDMEAIYSYTIDRGINIIGLDRGAAEAAVACRRSLHGRVHCE